MTHEELVEKVARAIDSAEDACFERDPTALHKARAQAAISTILAALQEPSLQMQNAGWQAVSVDFREEVETSDIWQSMLNASALGEQSE